MACLCCCKKKKFFLTRSASLRVLHNSISMESKILELAKEYDGRPVVDFDKACLEFTRKTEYIDRLRKEGYFRSIYVDGMFVHQFIPQDGLVDEDPELLLPAGRLKRTFIQLMEDIQRFGGTLSESFENRVDDLSKLFERWAPKFFSMKHRHAKRARNSARFYRRSLESQKHYIEKWIQAHREEKRFDPPNFMYLAILWAVSPSHFLKTKDIIEDATDDLKMRQVVPTFRRKIPPVRINPEMCSDPSGRELLQKLRHEQDMRLLNYTPPAEVPDNPVEEDRHGHEESDAEHNPPLGSVHGLDGEEPKRAEGDDSQACRGTDFCGKRSLVGEPVDGGRPGDGGEQESGDRPVSKRVRLSVPAGGDDRQDDVGDQPDSCQRPDPHAYGSPNVGEPCPV